MVKKFLFRMTFIIMVLLFGVLFGIHQANVGPLSIPKITVNSSVESPVEVDKVEKQVKSTQVEQQETIEEVKETTSVELSEKQEYAEAVHAFNFYSELGAKIGELFQNLFSSLITMVVSAVHSFLHP